MYNKVENNTEIVELILHDNSNIYEIKINNKISGAQKIKCDGFKNATPEESVILYTKLYEKYKKQGYIDIIKQQINAQPDIVLNPQIENIFTKIKKIFK